MPSKNDICNLALIKIGKNLVTDIDNPTTNEEVTCNVIFQSIADEVMASGNWPSVLKRTSITASETTPSFGYGYQYPVPTSPYCLFIVKLNECYPGTEDWTREGEYILSDIDTSIKILYRSRNTNIDTWDTFLQRSVVDRLVAELSLVLTGDKNKALAYMQEYRYNKDVNLDLAKQQSQNHPDNPLTDARI